MRFPSFWRRPIEPRSPEVWLHIGLPKCGSPSIQHYLAETDEVNRARGVFYPSAYRSVDGYRSHLPLAMASRRDDLQTAIREIREETSGSRSIVLSCEELSDALPGGGAPRLVHALNDTFGSGHVRIVCYFRNIFQFVESSYAQFLTGGLFYIDKAEFFSSGRSSIGDFMNCFERDKGFPIFSPAGFVECVTSAFPDNRVLFRSIEKEDLLGRSLTEDLCQLLGIPHTATSARPRNKRQPNRRVAALQYAQCVSDPQAFARVSRKMRGFRFAPSDIGQRPFRNSTINLDKDAADQIREALEADSEKLRAVFSTGVNGLLEDRWRPIGDEADLTEGEKEEICRFLR